MTPYVYVWDNPLKYVDPDGELPTIVLGAVIGAVLGVAVGAGSEIINAVVENRDVDWGEAGKNALGYGAAGAAAGALIGTGVGAIGATKIVTAVATAPEVVGAAAGGTIGGVSEVIRATKNNEEINIAKVALKTAEGTATGVLMGSGASIGVVVAKSAGISVVSSVVNDTLIDKVEPIDLVINAIANGAIGGFAGLIGGAGAKAPIEHTATTIVNIKYGMTEVIKYAVNPAAEAVARNMVAGSIKALGSAALAPMVSNVITPYIKSTIENIVDVKENIFGTEKNNKNKLEEYIYYEEYAGCLSN